MLELILDEFQQIKEIQRDQGLHQSRIYEIMTVMFDLISANTHWLGGLGKKLKEKLKESPPPMQPSRIGLGRLLIFLHC